MLRQLEGTWASGCDELLSLAGPQLISLLDPDRVIELQIRVEVLQALASALVRASQVLPSAMHKLTSYIGHASGYLFATRSILWLRTFKCMSSSMCWLTLLI